MLTGMSNINWFQTQKDTSAAKLFICHQIIYILELVFTQDQSRPKSIMILTDAYLVRIQKSQLQ